LTIALLPSETIIVGRAFLNQGKISGDENEKRIFSLVEEQLVRVGISLGDELYRDPQDGRAWEFAPYLPVMSGGPYILHALPENKVKQKYKMLGDAVELEKLAWRIFERSQRFSHSTYTNDDLKIKDYETMISAVSRAAVEETSKYKALRISWLTDNYLKFIGNHGDETLYFDERGECYWELVKFDYPPQALGGGTRRILPDPHILHCVDEASAKLKYSSSINPFTT